MSVEAAVHLRVEQLRKARPRRRATAAAAAAARAGNRERRRLQGRGARACAWDAARQAHRAVAPVLDCGVRGAGECERRELRVGLVCAEGEGGEAQRVCGVGCDDDAAVEVDDDAGEGLRRRDEGRRELRTQGVAEREAVVEDEAGREEGRRGVGGDADGEAALARGEARRRVCGRRGEPGARDGRRQHRRRAGAGRRQRRGLRVHPAACCRALAGGCESRLARAARVYAGGQVVWTKAA